MRRYRGTRDTSDDVLRDGFIRVVAVRGDEIGRVVQEAKFEILFEEELGERGGELAAV